MEEGRKNREKEELSLGPIGGDTEGKREEGEEKKEGGQRGRGGRK